VALSANIKLTTQTKWNWSLKFHYNKPILDLHFPFFSNHLERKKRKNFLSILARKRFVFSQTLSYALSLWIRQLTLIS